MSTWRKSNAAFWLGGRLFKDFWTEVKPNPAADRRICYRDPSAGAGGGASGRPAWAMTDLSKFGRTPEVDGAAMARQATEFCGMPWYAGGGRILFHLLGKWYLVPSSTWAWPKGLPYTARNEDGTYADDAMSWCESAAFDPWAKPGREYHFQGCGADPADADVTVTAPYLRLKSDGENDAFGEYEGGGWVGVPCWSGRGREVSLAAGVWIGAAMDDGVLVLGGDARYVAHTWTIGSDLVFSWAGGDDGEEHPDITLGWDGYGYWLDGDEWPTKEFGLVEVSIWR